HCTSTESCETVCIEIRSRPVIHRPSVVERVPGDGEGRALAIRDRAPKVLDVCHHLPVAPVADHPSLAVQEMGVLIDDEAPAWDVDGAVVLDEAVVREV